MIALVTVIDPLIPSLQKESRKTLLWIPFDSKLCSYRIPTDKQRHRNFYADERDQNFDKFQSTEVYLEDLFEDPSYPSFTCFAHYIKTCYSNLVGEFFQNHKPTLVFQKYGQDIHLADNSDVIALVENDFDLSRASELVVSVATNIKYIHPSTTGPIGLEDVYSSANDSEPLIDNLLVNEPPPGSYSLCISESGIKKWFGRQARNVTIYTKAFSKAFCNFDSSNLPADYENIGGDGISLSGLHGYSTVANILRRTSSSEPFMNRPVAQCFDKSVKAAKTAKNLHQEFLKTKATLSSSLASFTNVGADYRIECTYSYTFLPTSNSASRRSTALQSLKLKLTQIITEVSANAKEVIYKHGILVPTAVFPGAIQFLAKSMIETIDEKMKLYLHRPVAVSVEEKEYAVALENLVLMI